MVGVVPDLVQFALQRVDFVPEDPLLPLPVLHVQGLCLLQLNYTMVTWVIDLMYYPCLALSLFLFSLIDENYSILGSFLCERSFNF